MGFIETKVAKLDKEDIKLAEELEEGRLVGEVMAAAYISKRKIFWESLLEKHHLNYRKDHYIKDDNIYTQEITQ